MGLKLFVKMWRDEGTYGRDMPEELSELLATDQEGDRLFQALLPNHQRGIIYYVSSLAVSQTRIDWSIKMIDRLKMK